MNFKANKKHVFIHTHGRMTVKLSNLKIHHYLTNLNMNQTFQIKQKNFFKIYVISKLARFDLVRWKENITSEKHSIIFLWMDLQSARWYEEKWNFDEIGNSAKGVFCPIKNSGLPYDTAIRRSRERISHLWRYSIKSK